MRLFRIFLFVLTITWQPLHVQAQVQGQIQPEPKFDDVSGIAIANACSSFQTVSLSGSNLGLSEPNSGLEFPLRVLSWNIEKTNNEGWQEDLAQYSENFSLVLLQEAASHEELNHALAGFEGRSMAPGYHTGDVQTGVLTASKSPAIKHCYLQHTEPWLRSRKTAQLSWYPIKNASTHLLVVNIHSINFTLGVHQYQKQLQALTQIAAQHQGPMIISGDFNTWSSKRIQSLQLLAEQLNLEPVLFSDDNRTKAFGYSIDHIFTRGLIHQGSHTEFTTSSDHNPLFAELNIVQPERRLGQRDQQRINEMLSWLGGGIQP